MWLRILIPLVLLAFACAWPFRTPVLSSLSEKFPLPHKLLEMRWTSQVPLTGLVATAAATNLYVSSYIGTITSLQLIEHVDGRYSLEEVSVSNGCEPNPSWLTKDEYSGVIYCADEGLNTVNGSLNSFHTTANGVLSQIDRHSVASGPVSSVVYNDGKALAVAHYTGSTVSSWRILPSGGLEPLQAFHYTLSKPGTNPARQDAPHPHEVILDPTGSFILSPDLGADLVRVFTIDKKTSALTESKPLQAPPGTGPRHGGFHVTHGETFFFLASELGNTVTSYKVTYGRNSLSFKEVFVTGIEGKHPIPPNVTAAEVVLTPDHKFVLTSSRNDSLFEIRNFDPKNNTKLPSDSLQTWRIDGDSGKLTLEQLFPAGGSFPRQFSINKNGTLAAVGLQYSSRVVIVQRDIETGLYRDFVAEIDIAGQITSVIWDE